MTALSRRDLLGHLAVAVTGAGASVATGPAYAILGKTLAQPAWDGSATTLAQYASVAMPQTPNGSMMLAYMNLSKRNSDGKLAWTSGASKPAILPAPALALAPSVLVYNWQGNNLALTNISVGADTPIGVGGYGPGVGATPLPLPVGPPGVAIDMGQAAQGSATGGWMQLGFQQQSGELAVFGFIGGPADINGNNAYVIALNSPAGNTGYGTAKPAPPGYFATTSSNSWSYEFQWNTVIYVAYFGAARLVPQSGVAHALPVITLLSL